MPWTEQSGMEGSAPTTPRKVGEKPVEKEKIVDLKRSTIYKPNGKLNKNPGYRVTLFPSIL